MFDKPQPCQACQAQAKAGVGADPHPDLEYRMPLRNPITGEEGDKLFRCRACGSALVQSRTDWRLVS